MYFCASNRKFGYPIEEVSLSSAITHAVTPLGFGVVSGLIIVGISGDFYIVYRHVEVIREGSRPHIRGQPPPASSAQVSTREPSQERLSTANISTDIADIER